MRFHGEGLDDLHAAERFAERLVDAGQLREGSSIGAFERFRQGVDQVSGERCDHQGEEQELPTDGSRDREAGDCLERFSNRLADRAATRA